MQKSQLFWSGFLSLGLTACACCVPPSPQNFLGRLELSLGSLVQTQSTPPPNSSAQFTRTSFEDFVATDGFRYLKAVFTVTNTSSSRWDNLTLYAFSENQPAQGGAAVKDLVNFVGGNSSSNAQSVQPSHGVSGTTPNVVPLEADFQAFDETERMLVEFQAQQFGFITNTSNLLEYGFVARKSVSSRAIAGIDCNPSVNAGCNQGRVTVAYRVPNNQVSSAYGLTATFILVNEATTRITRGLQESTTAADNRAKTMGATEVVLLGEDTDTSGVGATKRLANLRLADGLNYLLPPAVLYAAGDIAGCSSSYQDEATANMLAPLSGKILTLGDNVYSTGTAANYSNCYDPSWGALKPRIHPVIGNHDYDGSSNAAYLAYFGANAGSSGNARHSFEYGGWKIIGLDSNCSIVSCLSTGAQGAWLQSTLSNNPRHCTLAAWHHPRFSSSSAHGSDTNLIPFWTMLQNANADLVLSGHDHTYERLAPMLADGTQSSAGIRSFVVGTGGAPQYAFGTPIAGSQYRENTKYGALKLELYPSGMKWTFIATDNSTGDSGEMLCR